jgi:putative dimethyl sulfoxide reductase chaperone
MTLAEPIPIDDATATRFAMYAMLTRALDFPSREFHQEVTDGHFLDGVRAMVDGLPYRLDRDLDLDGLLEGSDYMDFQAEYIRLFDVGAMRPPFPLYAGEWGSTRKRAMEDALRFYRFFGMKIDESCRELPDHVTVQLEFMQALAFTEGSVRASGDDALPFLRAERDFLERHPGRWWPLLRRKMAGYDPSRFYAVLTDLADAFFRAELAYLRSAISRAA